MTHISFPRVCQPLYLWREELSRRVVYNVGLELDTPYKFWLRHLLAVWLLASNSTSLCLVFLICKMGIVIISISYRFVVKKYQNNALYILQARILEWIAMRSSRGPSPPRDWIVAGRFFTTGVTWSSKRKWSCSVLSSSLRPHGL